MVRGKDKMLTTKEAADICKVTLATVVRWIHDGWLPAERFGRDWSVKAGDLSEIKKRQWRKENYPCGRPRGWRKYPEGKGNAKTNGDGKRSSKTGKK